MRTHEIRLLKSDGNTAMIHVTRCETALDAEVRVMLVEGVLYDRYEIWQAGLKVASGLNPNAAL